MTITILRCLTIISYFVAFLCVAYGAGKLVVNILMWSLFYGKKQKTPNNFICFKELGQYVLFWNLTVAIPILYVTMSLLLIIAVLKRHRMLLTVWMMAWHFLIALNLGIHVGFTVYHCSMTQAGILSLIYTFLASLEAACGVLVCALWWRWMSGSTAAGRVSEYMEEMAGKHWRRKLGLDRARSAASASSPSSAPRFTRPLLRPTAAADDSWISKLVPLANNEERILERKT